MDGFIAQLRQMRLDVEGEDSPPKPKVLEEISLGGIAKCIQKIQSSDNPKKVLVMTGAGISTAAGIPDFRTPGSGLYDNLQKYNLPNPQAIFDISYFHHNPRPFYHLAKEMYPGKFKPTLSHYFVKLLEMKGLLLRNYTQNIDTLERHAGVTGDSMVEAHGSYSSAHCITCGASYSTDYVKDKIFADELPLCTKDGCALEPEEDGVPFKGLIKPDIVFFGESLPERFANLAGKDMQEGGLLIVMGTSLAVQPFASLASRVRDDCPRLLINLEKVGESDPLMVLLGMGAGFDFSETSYRDVFLQSTCDDGVRKLAQLLGWEDELQKLYDTEHGRLDAEMKQVCQSDSPKAKNNDKPSSDSK